MLSLSKEATLAERCSRCRVGILRALLLCLVAGIFQTPALLAQLETQLVALVDKKPMVIEAPFPFVEVSRVLPEAFAQRRRNISAGNRLVAWFIPTLALKDQLNEKTERYRSLQIQIMKEMEPVRYALEDLQKEKSELIRTSPNLPQITEDDTDALFSILDLSRLGKRSGGQKMLGLTQLGEDSFTLCIATSAEGRDLRGGREIEASIACVTQLLINEKILTLTVSGPDISAKELRNAMRLTREWIALLRGHNNVTILKS